MSFVPLPEPKDLLHVEHGDDHLYFHKTPEAVKNDTQSLANGHSRSHNPAAERLQNDENGSLSIQLLTNVNLHAPSLEPVQEPFDYVCSLKSKNVRNKLVGGLAQWIPIPAASCELVASLVSDIHNASLMFDDMQDNSDLRRSSPATHTIFGMPQTVNSAVYHTVNTIERASDTENPLILKEVLAGMKTLLAGQGLDLVWTAETTIPTMEEYLQMIDGKTGALFIMISNLMFACLPEKAPRPPLRKLMLLLGRYFQIRDDYINLSLPEYFESKGFCSDLDEGKCSYIILHAMKHAEPAARSLLRKIMLQTRRAGSAGERHKQTVLAILERAGSLKHVKEMLHAMEDALIAEIQAVEDLSGVKNPLIRELFNALRA
ncbi:uncharacterized protein PgNI_12441 [Pyricularia grisea]|uniref:Uncharacterized protein n=1 Tax=Pyricularia grisea TaxID=148305 RepID=A0A6P8AMG0_PYRGI|nr:uncharacterized protein PgNI_12441 [Pyricularia grisea]TLD03204.1 hypothetical protein PgNI_12441 [Pyricularia grisea]